MNISEEIPATKTGEVSITASLGVVVAIQSHTQYMLLTWDEAKAVYEIMGDLFPTVPVEGDQA